MSAEPTDPTATNDGDLARPSTPFETWLRQAARAPSCATAVALPVLGQVISEKYRIEELLGAGGMGAVFRATHLWSDKPVALKWLLRPANDERAVRRFTREARAAGRIAHPNVVDIYDIGHDGSATYLVMELLQGESLRKRLSRGPLAPRAAIERLLPALHGVAAAHRAGVIHRDLKPDNLFLCCDAAGEPQPAKVLDFGISAILASDLASQTALTLEGMLLGTPSYMSPEQLEAGNAADVRSDIYAIGVILYETLTGRVPFRADNPLALARAIARGEPAPLRALQPEIPPQLEAAVLRALHRDPAQRPQTIDALIELLRPFADPSAHVPLPASRPLPAAIRRRGAFLPLVAAAAATALACTAAAYLHWLTPATRRAPSTAHALNLLTTQTTSSAAASIAAPGALEPAASVTGGARVESAAPGPQHPTRAVRRGTQPVRAKAGSAAPPEQERVGPTAPVASEPAQPVRRRAGTIRSDEL